MADITLRGRVFVSGDIHAITGLHIGAAAAPLAIGTVDNPVIRDPLTRRPYIPGSSLRGKMRSLSEKYEGLAQNQRIGRDVFIHVCKNPDSYQGCDVCHIFGVPAESYTSQTRLIVRDILLDEESAKELDEARPDLPYTEVKWEAAIDRVTSAATPRQIERVPAGARFKGMELVFNVYEEADVDRFIKALNALQLVEDDYLGGQGSRGSGKVEFRNMAVSCRANGDYATLNTWRPPTDGGEVTVDVLQRPDVTAHMKEWLASLIIFD